MEFARIDDTTGELPAELVPHFQGEARIQQLPSPFPDGPLVFAVHFQAGGRTRPHVHATGQVLHIVSGQGVVGDVDGRRLVEAGDVVVAEPGEWHWHGATPFSPMTHVTVQFGGPGSTDWDVEERDWDDDCPG
ncbi:MAG TPA: cupin domain-containing protein [Acidimicrobiales bacterium]|nr:cupin domain-containing protein [Acidimicrobiales bacterium]